MEKKEKSVRKIKSFIFVSIFCCSEINLMKIWEKILSQMGFPLKNVFSVSSSNDFDDV